MSDRRPGNVVGSCLQIKMIGPLLINDDKVSRVAGLPVGGSSFHGIAPAFVIVSSEIDKLC